MNTSLIKSALAMTAAFAVGSALAGTVTNQIYGATFESSPSNNEINDYAYDATEAPSISSYANGNLAKWYAGSADDASIITTEDYFSGSQALKLQTEGGTLTNEFQGDVLSAINAARTGEGTNLVFEAQVKFVASDTLDCGVDPDGDAKFALYAYAPDGGPTNLVVFHKFFDEDLEDNVTTNQVIEGITINTEAFSEIVVEYHTTAFLESQFSVSVNGQQAINGTTDDKWFATVNDASLSAINSLCFKGTGFVDDIAIKSVATEEEPPAPVGYNLGVTLGTGVASVTVTDSASVAFVTDATTNFTGVAAGNATIAIDYDDWYVAAGDYENGDTIDISADDAIAITAKQAAAADVTGKQASDFGITTGGFASADETTLKKVIGWAEANGVSVSDVNDMTFSNPAGSTNAEKAYLLGISPATYAANPAAAEAEAVAALEIASIEYVNGAWVIKSQNNKGDGDALLNGHIDIYGATTLAGPWAPDTVGAKFFKAVLVK